MPRKVSKSNWGMTHGRFGDVDEKHYYAHDDRARSDGGAFHIGNRPRVSFKTYARSGREIPRNIALACLDDDIPMGCSSNNNVRPVIMRGRRGICRGRNSPLPNRNFRGQGMLPRRHLPLGESNWYRVSIPYGHKYEKDYVLRTLLSYMAPEVFIPIMYKVAGNEATFHVDDQKTANALLNCDRKITMTDGFKLQIRVKPGFPQCEIDDKLRERLKHAMSKRYVQETNALDLSKFHQDSDLVDDYFCALFRPVMLMAVLDIVGEHIPNLEALNLEGNKLGIIERLNVLSNKFSKLKILYLGDNKIREINQLDIIKDLKLEELRLTGNPVCNKYKSRDVDYISDVRKRFPKLLRLDGTELPRPIVFDIVDEEKKLPSSQRIFAADAKAQEIANQFLQQYFMIFDSENRQPLLDAYSEHACFSLTVSNSNRLNGYFLDNRNLLRINDSRRHKLLKQGRLSVVSYISKMPRTRHYLNTFTMDISVITETMMFITLTGYFKELDSKELIRYFNRTFIIVPEGNGYCIHNEQLHLGQPSEAQLKQLLNQQNATAEMSIMPSIQQLPIEPVAQPGSAIEQSQLSEAIKQQMVSTLSQQTNMNMEWSLKCLQEVQWVYDNALSAFQEFYSRGQIPPAAFTK